MTPQQQQAILNHPAFQQLASRKTRLGWSLTAVMLLLYYGFILVLAFAPQWLARPIGAGVTTLGMPVGVAIILAAFALTGIYVRQANRRLDPLNDEVLRECQP
ncbi:DUF485 domain-containing protein [Chromobacterium haemolyticum]|uniref:DUF485 domain-containing protein n=1 Tax=Chromobacterium haemolyticum TaxID=394935 RepID=UPI0040554E9F